jgi:hypothetical protein
MTIFKNKKRKKKKKKEMKADFNMLFKMQNAVEISSVFM